MRKTYRKRDDSRSDEGFIQALERVFAMIERYYGKTMPELLQEVAEKRAQEAAKRAPVPPDPPTS